MPTSITPPPADDETECGNCGAYIYAGLVKCPNCGVYILDPPDTEPEQRPKHKPRSRLSLKLESLKRRLRGEKHECLTYYEKVLGFKTLELNFTYYALPSPRALAGLSAKTSEGFLFSVKAFKGLTHDSNGMKSNPSSD